MNRNLCRSIVLTCVLATANMSVSQAQGRVREFDASYSDCGLAINYRGEVASTPCKLIFTYDGDNLNLHFNSREGNVNFITTSVRPGAVRISDGNLYLATGTYYLSHIRLTSRGDTVPIEGKGQCKKTASDITCIFDDTKGNRFVGVVQD